MPLSRLTGLSCLWTETGKFRFRGWVIGYTMLEQCTRASEVVNEVVFDLTVISSRMQPDISCAVEVPWCNSALFSMVLNYLPLRSYRQLSSPM